MVDISNLTFPFSDEKILDFAKHLILKTTGKKPTKEELQAERFKIFCIELHKTVNDFYCFEFETTVYSEHKKRIKSLAGKLNKLKPDLKWLLDCGMDTLLKAKNFREMFSLDDDDHRFENSEFAYANTKVFVKKLISFIDEINKANNGIKDIPADKNPYSTGLFPVKSKQNNFIRKKLRPLFQSYFSSEWTGSKSGERPGPAMHFSKAYFERFGVPISDKTLGEKIFKTKKMAAGAASLK